MILWTVDTKGYTRYMECGFVQNGDDEVIYAMSGDSLLADTAVIKMQDVEVCWLLSADGITLQKFKSITDTRAQAAAEAVKPSPQPGMGSIQGKIP